MLMSISMVLAIAGTGAGTAGLVTSLRALPRPRLSLRRALKRARPAPGMATGKRRKTEASPSQTGLPTQSGAAEAPWFAASSMAFGLGSVGLFYPPALVTGAALSAASMAPVFWDGTRLLAKRRITVDAIDSLVYGACVATAQIVLLPWCAFVAHLSRFLVARTKDDSYRRLSDAFRQDRRPVWVLVDGAEVQVPLEGLRAGDVVAVGPGEPIPCDGVVVRGSATLNQALLTGEDRPVDVDTGDQVLAATLVMAGRLHIRADRTGEESRVARIAAMLNTTDDYRRTVAARGEAHLNRVAPPTVAAGLIAAPFFGTGAMVAIWNSVPGYMYRVVAPVGMLAMLTHAADRGLLIRDARVLELLRRVDTVVFDKTGTVTTGRPHVEHVGTLDGWSAEHVLILAAAAEYHQLHPLAEAIRAEAVRQRLSVPEPEWAEYEAGRGIRAVIHGRSVHLGSLPFLASSGISIPEPEASRIREALDEGRTIVGLAVDQKVAGYIVFAATLRPEMPAVVMALRLRGITSHVMSGDLEEPTREMAQRIGADRWYAEQPPDGKARLVRHLQDQGRTICFVGDGLNDAIAMRQAQVSICLEGAAPVTADSADIILCKNDLARVVTAIDLAMEYNLRSEAGKWLCTLPGVAATVSTIFLGTGLITSILSNQIGLWTGIAAAKPLPTALRPFGKKEPGGTTIDPEPAAPRLKGPVTVDLGGTTAVPA